MYTARSLWWILFIKRVCHRAYICQRKGRTTIRKIANVLATASSTVGERRRVGHPVVYCRWKTTQWAPDVESTWKLGLKSRHDVGNRSTTLNQCRFPDVDSTSKLSVDSMLNRRRRPCRYYTDVDSRSLSWHCINVEIFCWFNAELTS